MCEATSWMQQENAVLLSKQNVSNTKDRNRANFPTQSNTKETAVCYEHVPNSGV